MKRKIEIDLVSFAGGAAVATALGSLPTMLGAAWSAVASVSDAVGGLPSGITGAAAVVSAAALLAGAAWAVSTRRPAHGFTVWSLAPGSTADFVAYQRQAFPFLPAGEAEPGPLTVEQWLLDRTGHAGPWAREEFEEALGRQLTRPFTGLATAPDRDVHRAALALLFALKILRSPTFPEVRNRLSALWDRAAGTPRETAAKETVALVEEHLLGVDGARLERVLRRAAERHHWWETALMALLAKAREHGVLGEAEFLWLKQVDRPLFYALNALDRPSAPVEGIGAACQYEAERLHGAPLDKRFLTPAVAGLRRVIAERRGGDPHGDAEALA